MMDTGTQGVEFVEACGYALEEHQKFWGTLPAERRRRLVADFTKKMQAANVSVETAKAAARLLGVEVSEYKDAAHTLAGFEVWDWMVIDWAGPRWLHNPETRPDWATRAKDQGNEEAENSSTEERKPYETLTLKNLKTMRKRSGALRWTQKTGKNHHRSMGRGRDRAPQHTGGGIVESDATLRHTGKRPPEEEAQRK